VIANAAGVTLSTDATLNNLTIQSGALLTIAPQASLTVNGNLINGGPATGFQIDGEASLIHQTPGVAATINRPVEAASWSEWQDGWHFLSSPVLDQVIDSAGGFITSGAGNDFDFYTWSEPDNNWVNFKNTTEPPTFTTINGGGGFIAGRGYLAAYQQTGTKRFSGPVNVANVSSGSLPVSGQGSAGRGWHLLGNPYPCALSWYTNWDISNIGGVAQVWNEEGQSYTPRNPDDLIPSCNGFMVQVTGAPGDSGHLTIPASARVHGTVPWFRHAAYPVISLLVRDLDYPSFQESQVRFNPASTSSFDPEFDGRFLAGYAPRFYSVSGDEKLSVNSLESISAASSIPFYFEKGNGLHYQLEMTVSGGVGEQILLSDRQTGSEHNLSEDPVYSFEAEENASPGRFTLHFRNEGIQNHHGNKPRIVAIGNSIVIDAPEVYRAEVFTLTGARCWSGSTGGRPGYPVSVAVRPGFYLVRLSDQGAVIVRKIHVGTL
jgi:hypothetical protein